MRIAIISFHGCPVARLGEKDTGGMNVYVLNLAKELARLGHTVDVFTRFHDPLDPEIVELEPGAKVIHIKAGPFGEKKAELPFYIREFVDNLVANSYTAGNSYDLIHSNYWISGEVASILSDRWESPHVATFHTLAKTKLRARAGERESSLRINLERQVMDQSTEILALTQAEKSDIINMYGMSSSKVSVIPAGVDTRTFYPEDKTEAKQKLGINSGQTILYAGRIEPIKGLDILLDAFRMLDGSGDAQLIIVGGSLSEDKELDRLRSNVDRLGVSEKVMFTGSVGQSELRSYYSAADVFALPSHYESFGLVALEAMACGTPIVASRVGGIPSFVDDGVNGYLIPWRCPEPFADRIEMLLQNSDLRKIMGRAAQRKARAMDWRFVASQVADYYCKLSRCDQILTAV